jgi:hypothetical protein
MTYIDFIEKTHLLDSFESTLTTGDLEYNGTALEISEKGKGELFHIVLDKNGNRQILFFSNVEDYRMSLDELERLIQFAKRNVVTVK